MKSKKATNGVCTPREYQDLLSKVKQLEADKLDLFREVKRLKTHNDIYSERINKLTTQNLFYRQRINALVAYAHCQRQDVVRRDADEIADDVRRRFLEKHRQRIYGQNDSRATRVLGDGHIDGGNRAAHRGRPLIDARVTRDQYFPMDERVFVDLYGFLPERLWRWREFPPLYDVVGMRGSLRSEGVECSEFEEKYWRLLELEAAYEDVRELEEAFERDPTFLEYAQELKALFDGLEDDGTIRTIFNKKLGITRAKG